MELSPFKRLVLNDVRQVFLNLEEFGETHNINGKSAVVIFDDVEHVEREKRVQSHMDGVYSRQMFLYIASEDFGKLPAQGSTVKVDGRIYTTVDATDECGIFAITLEANRNR